MADPKPNIPMCGSADIRLQHKGRGLAFASNSINLRKVAKTLLKGAHFELA